MKIDGIPDELNELPLVKEAPDLAAIIKSAQSAQQMLGNSLRVPGEGASDADKAAFRAKAQQIGLVPRDKFHEFVRPEKPEQYALTNPPKDADKVVTQTEINTWKAWAHTQGLSPQQFEAFANSQIEGRVTAAIAQQTRYAEVDKVVKDKYGDAGLNAAKERALAAALKFGGKPFADKLAAQPDAETIIALAEVGKLFGERGMGDLTPQPHFTETREEAARKLDEIRRNKQHAFNQPRMLVGKDAKEAANREVMRLQALAMGEQPAKGDYMFVETA